MKDTACALCSCSTRVEERRWLLGRMICARCWELMDYHRDAVLGAIRSVVR